MKTHLYFILIVGFLFTSCSDTQHSHLIDRAEIILDTNPDSAYVLLHSIKNPEKLNRKHYMKYIMLDVLAKYRTYRDIKKDTLIFKAANFFNKNPNLYDKALANYAAASVMSENEKYADAMVYYKNAEKLVANTTNGSLKGLIYNNIASLYDRQLMVSEAIKHYKLALDIFSKTTSNKNREINTLINIGTDYLFLKKLDDALASFHDGLQLSIEIDDTRSQSMILNNIGLVYQQKENYAQAMKYFSKAVNINTPDIEQNYRYKLNLASACLKINDIETAGNYVEVLNSSLDSIPQLSYQVSVVVFLKDYYKNIGDDKKSLYFSEMNNDLQYKLFDINQSSSLLEAEKKYDYTVHKTEAEKAKLTQRVYILLFVGIILLIGIASIIIWYRYSRQKLVEEIELKSLQIKQQQQELENQQLQREVGRFKYINIALNKVMEKANELHFEIKDIVQAGILHEKSDRHKKIQQKLKETQDTIKENIAYNAESFLIERSLIDNEILKKLSDEEKIIITMLFYKESRKSIANILSISPQAVYNRVPRLKEKLILLGLEEDIIDLFFSKDYFNTI